MTALESVLHALRATTDPDDARALLAQAAVGGVNPRALRVAWESWQQLRAAEVTVLHTSDAMRDA